MGGGAEHSQHTTVLPAKITDTWVPDPHNKILSPAKQHNTINRQHLQGFPFFELHLNTSLTVFLSRCVFVRLRSGNDAI